MKKILDYLPVIVLIIGGWAFVNGILHTIAVLNKYISGGYSRELFRLLTIGQILIFSGLMQMISYVLIRSNNKTGLYIALLSSISLLAFCFMAFPFLKSIATISFEIFLIVLLAFKIFSNKQA